MYSEGTDLFTTPGQYAIHFFKDIIRSAFDESEDNDTPIGGLGGVVSIVFAPLVLGMGYLHCKTVLEKVTPDQANELEKELGEKLTIH